MRIDLRTYPDNGVHGGGLTLKNTRDGVKLEIKRTVGGSHVCHRRCIDGGSELQLEGYSLLKFLMLFVM